MSQDSALEQAIEYIQANWKDGKTLKEIADLHRLDAGNLERSFRNRQGMTVKHFLDQRRKEHVASRLADKTLRGYEIGAELGFADDLAFYRWVKRAFGISFAVLRAQIGCEPRNKKTRQEIVTKNRDFSGLMKC